MIQLTHRLLRYTLILLQYEVDGKQEYRCNLLNPLTWIALVVFGVYSGVAAVLQVLKDSLEGERAAAGLFRERTKTPKTP